MILPLMYKPIVFQSTSFLQMIKVIQGHERSNILPIRSRRDTISAKIDANRPVIMVAINGVPVGGNI